MFSCTNKFWCLYWLKKAFSLLLKEQYQRWIICMCNVSAEFFYMFMSSQIVICSKCRAVLCDVFCGFRVMVKFFTSTVCVIIFLECVWVLEYFVCPSALDSYGKSGFLAEYVFLVEPNGAKSFVYFTPTEMLRICFINFFTFSVNSSSFLELHIIVLFGTHKRSFLSATQMTSNVL